MILSVIIVNYNVKQLLEQCLYSVYKSAEIFQNEFDENSLEIIVVDNNSPDDSCQMVKDKYPEVKLIENKVNTGFSVANNQAIKMSKSEFALLLNPDTLVEEKTFVKIIRFMNKHADAGALGVKMIDGNGIFLSESKRALPTPAVSFYKISGLDRLFPQSKKFGKYHLKYLSSEQTHKIEILSGAFMLLRKKVLDEVGLLDETFFMYGEDIDLSYRIIKAGYNNYYFHDTTILHYKGESTKKNSIKYIYIFYNAMLIFAKKHFSQKSGIIFTIIIKFAVILSAAAAYFSVKLKKLLSVFKNLKSKEKNILTFVDNAQTDKILNNPAENYIEKNKITEIVFNLKNVEISKILKFMIHFSDKKIIYKIK